MVRRQPFCLRKPTSGFSIFVNTLGAADRPKGRHWILYFPIKKWGGVDNLGGWALEGKHPSSPSLPSNPVTEGGLGTSGDPPSWSALPSQIGWDPLSFHWSLAPVLLFHKENLGHKVPWGGLCLHNCPFGQKLLNLWGYLALALWWASYLVRHSGLCWSLCQLQVVTSHSLQYLLALCLSVTNSSCMDLTLTKRTSKVCVNSSLLAIIHKTTTNVTAK